MFISTVAAMLCLSVPAIDDTPLVCAMMGSPVNAKSPAVEYAGLRVGFCCKGCDIGFSKNPVSALDLAVKKAQTVAEFLFDPVAGTRIDVKEAKWHTDWNAVRWSFASEENLKTFLADPKTFGSMPKKESLTCPVTGEAVKAYSAASGYVDFEDVRYYSCCAGCTPAMAKDMKGLLAKGRAKVAEPKPMPALDAKPMVSSHGCCAGGACKDGNCPDCKDKKDGG